MPSAPRIMASMAHESKRTLVLLGLFCLVPLVNFPRALFLDRALFARDIAMVWAPQVEAVVRQVGRGEFPFFDSRRGFGQPLFADPRAEVLYPPAWIHLLAPPEKSYAWFCAFHLVLAAFGAARLARRLVPGASVASQAVAGIAYAAGGPLLSLVSHWHHLAAAAWMPWILEKAEISSDAGTPWLGLSSLVLLQILAGSPDYTFLTLLLCALRLLTRRDPPPAARARTAVALGLGILMASAQLLPSLVFAREAARPPLPVGWSISPLPKALTIETVMPVRLESWPLTTSVRASLGLDGQPWMFSHYLGLSVWVLAFLGFCTWRGRDRGWAAGLVGVGLVLAWGLRDPTAQEFIAHVPLLSGLRFPTKHLAASSLGLALLAAGGTRFLGEWPARARLRAGLGVAGVLGLCVTAYLATRQASAPFAPWLLARPALALLCVAGILFAGSRARRAAAALPALVAIDLLGVHTAINPTTPAALFRDRPPLSRHLPAGARLYVSDYSIETVAGPIRLPPTPPYALARVPTGFERAEALALAATWYLNPPSAGRFGYFGSFDLDILDFYRAPLRATVDRFVTSRDASELMEQLRRGSVDFVVTMDRPELWRSLPLVAEERRFFEAPVRVLQVADPWPRARYETREGERAAGAPELEDFRDGRVRVRASPTEPTRLVIALSHDRGWRATVDGKEAPTTEDPMGFLAVDLDPGSHEVEFDYVPPLFGTGVLVSALAALIALALGIGAPSGDRPRA